MKYLKKLIYSLLLFVLFNSTLYSQNFYSSSKQSYNSLPSKSKSRLYYRWHLQNLSKTVSPRYIRFLDIDSYMPGKRMVKKGVLFTCKAPFANHVYIAGNFSGWHKLEMKKNKRGIWFTIIPPAGEYRKDRNYFHYKFNIDGIWILDRNNKNQISDSQGGYYSGFHLTGEDINPFISVRKLPEDRNRYKGKEAYEFRTYKPGATTVYLVGTFNHFNPGHDAMIKSENGIFRLKKHLPPGKYLYYFIVDGRKKLDLYNPEVRKDAITDISCSYLHVK